MFEGTTWVLGHGHSIDSLFQYIKATGKDPVNLLDELVVNKDGKKLPAIIMEQTSHSVWVNSEALKQANLDVTTIQNNVNGNVYMLNAAKTGLNGILLENAGISIMEMAMDPTQHTTLVDMAYQGLKKYFIDMAKIFYEPLLVYVGKNSYLDLKKSSQSFR